MLGRDQFPYVSDFQVRQPVLRLDKVIPSDPTLLEEAVREITAGLHRTVCWGDVETIGLAVREAIANAIVHGNHCDPEKTVRISVALNGNCDLLVRVKDSGSGFDPNGLAQHGRGIFLIRQLMDEVDFKFDHGTEVRMRLRERFKDCNANVGRTEILPGDLLAHSNDSVSHNRDLHALIAPNRINDHRNRSH